eukprot:724162_1
MCRRHDSTNKGRDLVTNDIHPKAGKYSPVQLSSTLTQLGIILFLTIVGLLFVTLWFRSVIGGAFGGIDHTTSNEVIKVPTTVVFEKDKAPRVIDGFYKESTKNGNPLHVDVRKLLVSFIGEPFDLEWRGTVLVAVLPHPIDFYRHRIPRYEFVAKNDEGKEILIPHLRNTYTLKSDWKSPDKPE